MLTPECCFCPSTVAEPSAGDLKQFFSDIALTQLVVFESQAFDQSRGVVGCVRHRHHSSALFAGFGFEQNSVNQNIEINSKQVIENCLWAWFKKDLSCV